MPAVVSMQLSPVGKLYDFAAEGFLDAVRGDYLIVEVETGPALAQVVRPPHASAQNDPETLRPVLRKATIWDFLEKERRAALEQEALALCRRIARAEALAIKIVQCEYDLAGGRLTVRYSHRAHGKAIHQQLRRFVRQLAPELGVRVNMQVLNDRGAAKILDGVGKCGRQLCCTTWLRAFPDVKLRMAKDQQLSLNADEISGVCGRLLCCLSYEDDMYRSLTRSLPKVGAKVLTPQGEGRVRFIYPLKKTVSVELEGKVLADFNADELLPAKKNAQGCGPCGGCTHTRRAQAENRPAQRDQPDAQ